jgi:NTP pyrophosphatase (non-canonical NTP hydrolase)
MKRKKVDITIREIQEWEKSFSKRKGLPPTDKSDSHQAMIVGFLKLAEEVGELAEALLRKQYEEIPSEVADILIFACKIGKIVEDYFGQSPLSEEVRAKINYAEKREYNKSSQDLTKPKGDFKNWKKGKNKNV